MPSKLNKPIQSFHVFAVAFLTLAFVAVVSTAQQPIKDLKPTVILISLDGFRWDYLDKYKPPELNRLAREGVRARWMIPAFPTKTFPNHYTIATGLYPEHHGIIENNIWDFGVTFSMGKREEVENSRWYLGEPIWATAEKQGVRAAAFFFPGTETEIAGKRPTFWKPFDDKFPNEARIDQILEWLDLPVTERPRMFTLYFSDVDHAGHDFSPDSVETGEAVKKVDAMIARLMAGLNTRRIEKEVNLIVVSDHGMATVDQRNAIVMDDYLNRELTDRVLTTGEIWQIFPKQGQQENIIASLRNIRNATCWRRNKIPRRLRYNKSSRIAPIVCSAREGWFMTSRERYETQKKRNNFSQLKGAHGYDNRYESMRATFIAHGSAFRKNYVAEPFENVEVYNLMCKILGLKPAPNDGNLKRVRRMLR